MYELFIAHADICVRMAAYTNASEVRDQWRQLEAHWQSKADACKLPLQAPERESIRQFEISPSTGRAPQQIATPKTFAASSEPKPELGLVTSGAARLAPRDDQVELEAIWQALQAPAKSVDLLPNLPSFIRRVCSGLL